jgi:hypothetical protein
MDEVKGKTNFIGWKREFERAAKANDVLEYLTGEEVVPPKPRNKDYFVKSIEANTHRPRTRKTAQSFTPSTDDDDDETADVQTMMSTNNSLRWQIDSDEYKTAKGKMKLIGRLLDAWVSDGIKIEIEDCIDTKDAYDFIKKRYIVSMERARNGLLN